MKDFATENQARDDLSAKPSTVELQAGDGPVTAYVLLSREPEEFNSAAQSVSFGSMELSSAKVYADEAEAIGFAEVTGAKLEKVEIPGGLARDVFLKKWMKAAKKNKQGLLPFLLLPLAACGGGGGAPVTFTVTEAANLISFGGTATGDITASTTGVTTTFTRGSLTGTADNVFAAGAPKQIIAASGQTVVVTGAQIAGPNELLASGAGNVTINATDAGAGTVTTVSTKINVALTGGTLTFDMSNDNEDSITLTAGSVINLGGGTLVVSDGKVNASGVAISNVSGVTLNSTLVVDLADFKEIQDAGGFTGTGTLEVNPSTSDAVGTTTNLGTGGVGVAAGAITNAEFTEAEYLALFVSGVAGGNTSGAVATGNLATLAANSVTIVGSVSNTDVLASLQTNVAKIAAGGVTAITLANDAAITTFSALVANAGVAADSVTVTNGAITGAKAAIVASVAKFKADQIDSITLTDAEAAVTGFLADDAFNADSVTIGAVTTSEAAVLANGREIANNGITAITITAAEFDTFIDANTNAPFQDESVTLGDVTTNQADVVTNIAKVVDGGIASITLTAAQFVTIVTGGVNSLDALQTHSVTISDPANMILAGAVTQAEVQVGLALNVKGSVTLDASAVTGATASHAELMSLYAANAAGTISGLGNENLVANDAGISVSEANNLAAKTSGTLTASLSNTVLADYAGLEGTGNVYTISIADAAIDADALVALNAKTTGTITLAGDTSISGTLANVNTVLAGAGLASVAPNLAITVTDASITVAEADALSELTTGLVTATVAPGALAATNTAFADSGGQVNNISFTVTDSTAAAATLNALDAKTTVDIDVSAANAISGLHADIVTLYGNTANFVSLGNENITATDGTITIAEANALAALTTGTITAQIAAGTANALATGVNGTGNAYTLDVSDGAAVDAADLLALNSKTTVAVDLQLITAAGTALNGTYAELKTLFAAAASGDYTGLAGDLPITIDDNVSVSQANEINALTSAAVTATISNGDMITLNGLEGTGNVYAITVADVSGDMGELNALNAKTTGVLTVAAVNTLTGTNAELTTMLGGQATLATAVNFTGFNAAEAIILSDASVTAAQADTASQATTGLLTATVAAGALGATNTAFADSGGQVNNISFTVTDSTAAAATLNALDAKTTVDIDVSAANAISGLHADIVTLYGNTANFVSLGNENITATDGTITIAEANALAALTTGTITAQIAAGTANALATGVNGTGNAYTLDVSDGAAVDAADLLALNSKTTVAVDLQLITAAGTALNGTYAELKTLFAAAASGDYTGLAGDLPITIDDNVSVSQANEINALTSAAVTATISNGDMITLNGLEGTGNVYAITVADVSGDMGELNALNAKTTGVLTVAAVNTLTGTNAELTTMLGGQATLATAVNFTGFNAAEAIILSDASVTAAQADTASQATTGLLTATVAAGALGATNTAFADSGGQVNNISFTVTDSTAAAATLNALDAKTTVDIDVSAANAISGLHADIVTLYGNTANFVSLGNENITATDGTITIAEANALAALTTGTITAQIAAGTANALATGVNGTGNAYTLDVSDGAAVDAADLLALNSKTTVAVDLQLITAAGTALNGTYAELKTLFAAAASGDYTGLAGDLPITIDDNVSVSQANEINALTSAAVTATISNGDMITLNGLEGTGNVYAITVADVSGDMGELNALNAKTTGVLTVAAVNTLTGTNAELTTMLGGQATLATAVNFTGFNAAEAIILSDASVTAAQADTASQATTGLLTATVAAGALGATNTAFADSGGQVNNISFTVTDSTAAAATLNALDAKTTVDIDVSAANAISGANADIVTLYGNTANFVGLGNENITATDASITVAQAVTLLGFTSGSLTGTITAAGATTTQLASLAAFDSQIAGTITNLSLGITASTAAQSRSAQFDGLTDTQAQALFNHAAGGVTVTGNAGADWIDLRGFNTTGVDFTINALAGDNKIYSGDGNDTITTTTGADFINVGGGRDTVNAGAGIDQIEVDSLDNVDGSVYDGEGDNDTLTVKGINDLTNTVQTSLETLDLQPGSPSEVTLTGSQAEAYGTISGTAGNSKLIIQAEMAKVTYAGAAAKLDGGGSDTVDFTYQGGAKQATGNFSTLAELQTAVDTAVGGANRVVASLSNGNADITLTTFALGQTIIHSGNGYNDSGSAAINGAAAAEDATVDMSSVAFQNLAELKADAGVGIALSIANVANIGAVESDNNSVGLDLDGTAISSDLDISAMSLTPASGVVNLTVNSGATFTATAAQVVSTSPSFATTGGGTTKIIGASGAVQNSTLDLGANGVVNTTAVIVDVGANMSVTTDALTNVTGFNIQAGKTLTIDSDKVSGKTVTGDGTMVMNIGTDNFNLSNVNATVSATGTVAASAALHTSANLGTLVTTVNNSQTLTLLATQATGKTINGAGSVTINTLNGSAAADLSKITVSGTKLAKVADNVTFTGDLNGFNVDVAGTKTLTSSAAKLTGLSVIDSTGNAGITVTDFGAAALNASNFDIGGALLVKTVSNGDTTITLNGSTNILGATAATKTIDITDGGDTLVATAAQLDALTVTDTATGNVTVTALGAADFDISNFTIAGNLLAQTETGSGTSITLGNGSDFTAGTVSGTRTVDITDNGDTLIATAANLHEVRVTDGSNTSNLTVTALGNAEFDGSGINIGGNLLMTTVDDGTDNETFTLNAGTVLVGNTVTGTRTLNILDSDKVIGTAAQLTGLTVGDASNTGSVEVTALGAAAFDASNYDLGGNLVVKTDTGAGNFALHSTTKIVEATIAGTTTIDVTDNNSTLTATAAQVTGIAVTDAALANLTVTALGATKMDLSGVSITGDLLVQTETGAGTSIALHADTKIVQAGIGGGKTRTLSITENGDNLTATAAQLTGLTITDVGTSNVIVNDLGATKFEANAFSIAGTLTVNTATSSGANTITLDAGTKIVEASSGGIETINITETGDTLVATAAQLTGLTITDGGADANVVGNVSVTALEATATADFSNVSLHATATKTANAANTVDFTGDLGGFAVTVAAGKTFEATAARLSGIAVTNPAGNATTKVTDVTYAGGATLDLSGIQTNAITFGNGSTDLTLGAGTTLSIREAHLANIAGGGGADTIVDGTNTAHVKVYGFTGDVDIAEINVDGNVTGYVSGAQSITADATNIEELTALVIQSGGSLAMTQAQANAFAGKLTKESGAGNVSASVSGDLSALNLSVVDALSLSGAVTSLVDSTADLKAGASIDANSAKITARNTVDLSGLTITEHGDLEIVTNQLTLSAAQLHAFDTAGAVTKTTGGLIIANVGSNGNISALDLTAASSIVLDTNNSSTTMTTTQNALVASGQGTNTITLSNNGTTNGVAGIENYVLSSAGANSFTLASNTAQVTGGSNNDTIVGGTGVSTIIGGQGVDILSGDTGADTFSFSTGHTGQTALTADRILDFTTNSDKIKVNATLGDVEVVADGVNMLFSAFVTAASTSFDGTGVDVYAAYNVSGSGDTYVAVDHDASGTFNTGDSLIILNNLNQDAQLVAGDFIA